MRKSIFLLLLVSTLGCPIASAAEEPPPPDIKGLWLTTDFPVATVRAGEEARFNVSVINYGLAPQRATLAVDNAPKGWKVELRGGGRQVAAAFVDYNDKANLDLKINVPADANPGRYSLLVKAESSAGTRELPIALTVEPPPEAELTAESKLPTLRGTPNSTFDFQIATKNDSADDMLVTLTAEAPRGFQVAFKEAYGTQELTSIPIKAGESKDISVEVKPPRGVAAGQYPVMVRFSGEKAAAQSKLVLDITGQPSVTLTGEHDRLSGEASAGTEKRFTFVLRNTGSAEARNLSLGSSPPSGWKVSFEPKEIPLLAPNAEEKVAALVTPSEKALAGDYMLSVRASGDGVSESVNYRITVVTSTMWGIVGLAVIAASLLVLVGAVGEVRPAMSTPVIEAKALTKRYRGALAVDRLDLSVERGEVFGLLGPNGAGKTTTILMILGLTEPTSGSITTVGYNPLRQPLEVKRRVGYLPDSVGFYDHMTGRDNLRFIARLGGIRADQIESSIEAALQRVRLAEVADQRVGTYSRGMRQRLGIAEILMRRVEVAILDEPTSGLDPQTTREFLELIRSLKGEGMTILLSSHLLDLVQSICDRVALFSGGRIGLSGPVDDLMRDVLGGRYVLEVEAVGESLPSRLSALDGVQQVTPLGGDRLRVDAMSDVRGAVAKAVVEAGGELRTLSMGSASLEDVYTRYFEGVRHAA